MQEDSMHIRKSIIPDSSVKLLELCLSDDANEFWMPTTQRSTKTMEYRSDVTLKELITQKIQSQNQALTSQQRKKVFTKNAIRDALVEKDMISFCKIFPIGLAPITMRKHLLYQQSRAG